MKVELILRLLTDNQKLLLQRAYPKNDIMPVVQDIVDANSLVNLGFFEKAKVNHYKLTHKGNNLISEILNEST
jgi:predicted transcriptional regulator